MKELIDKLSSYNIFNYLFPGALSAHLISSATDFNLVHDNMVNGLFLYYFIGLIVSRIGSLILEPALQKTGIVKYEQYTDYLSTIEKDEDIRTFSEVNNMYRTLLSMTIVVLFTMLFNWVSNYCNWSEKVQLILTLVLLMILFTFSYRKQSQYISKRINYHKEK